MKDANKPSKKMKWAESRIEEVQALCQEAFSKFTKVFGVPINTKMHRIMNHVKDQVMNYGSIALGDASENETLHVGLKKCFSATNRQKNALPQQLLRVNVAADMQEANDFLEAAE